MSDLLWAYVWFDYNTVSSEIENLTAGEISTFCILVIAIWITACLIFYSFAGAIFENLFKSKIFGNFLKSTIVITGGLGIFFFVFDSLSGNITAQKNLRDEEKAELVNQLLTSIGSLQVHCSPANYISISSEIDKVLSDRVACAFRDELKDLQVDTRKAFFIGEISDDPKNTPKSEFEKTHEESYRASFENIYRYNILKSELSISDSSFSNTKISQATKLLDSYQSQFFDLSYNESVLDYRDRELVSIKGKTIAIMTIMAVAIGLEISLIFGDSGARVTRSAIRFSIRMIGMIVTKIFNLTAGFILLLYSFSRRVFLKLKKYTGHISKNSFSGNNSAKNNEKTLDTPT